MIFIKYVVIKGRKDSAKNEFPKVSIHIKFSGNTYGALNTIWAISHHQMIGLTDCISITMRISLTILLYNNIF